MKQTAPLVLVQVALHVVCVELRIGRGNSGVSLTYSGSGGVALTHSGSSVGAVP